jgi:6-phosphogluconolactonase (cycloisomerase 2 family)
MEMQMQNIENSEIDVANFYAAIGTQLTHFKVDITKTTLQRSSSIELGLNIQYVWRHPSLNIVYLVISNGGPGRTGSQNQLVACDLHVTDGSIKSINNAVDLPHRPIHLSMDTKTKHLLVAYNNPCFISVHKIGTDGSLGAIVKQKINLDGGTFGHQVMVTPNGTQTILICRGYDPDDVQVERPGALKIFGYNDGELLFKESIAPNQGVGFGARHLDFHPNGSWIYLAVERQSELHLLHIKNGSIDSTIAQSVSTLSKSIGSSVRQAVSAVHVHPSGNFVYISNRTYASTKHQADNIIPCGEDNIAVFKINEHTGEVIPIQHCDTNGSLPRTFSIDPSGQVLIAANSENAKKVTELGQVKQLPISLNLFVIGPDGRLEQIDNIAFQGNNQSLFWAGFL